MASQMHLSTISSPAGGQVGSSGNNPEAAGLAIPVQIAPLNFSVDQYIAIGSPLGLFLALRKVRLPCCGGQLITMLLSRSSADCHTGSKVLSLHSLERCPFESRRLMKCSSLQIDPGLGAGLGTPAAARLMPGGGGGCDGLPAVNRAYNLYQPYDPIAYRMEPLAVAGGEKRRPLFAPYHRGGRRIHIGIQVSVWNMCGAVHHAPWSQDHVFDLLKKGFTRASIPTHPGRAGGHRVGGRRLWQQRRPRDWQHVGQRAQRVWAGGGCGACGQGGWLAGRRHSGLIKCQPAGSRCGCAPMTKGYVRWPLQELLALAGHLCLLLQFAHKRFAVVQ